MNRESARRDSRVAVDTNVWISAALVASGTPARLVARVLRHGVPILSNDTWAELESRLWQPKFDRYLDIETRKRFLHELGGAADWVEVTAVIAAKAWCRDAADDKFLHAALAGNAGWLISGDADLQVLRNVESVRIASPAEALQAAGFCPP